MEVDTTSTNTWDQAVSWIEKELAGKVINARSQGRWRAAWFFDLQRGNVVLPMYFRGHRPGLGKDHQRLVLEMNILQILEKHGLPVPHIYGLCPEPEGIIMECKPGRENLATADSQADREAVLDQYIDALVAMHNIDLKEFEAIGMVCPDNSDARGLADLAKWEGIYRKQKHRPEPLIEFVTKWLKNNMPSNRDRSSFLHVDSGQFIFEGNQLSAMLDFELSILGDPAADLAGLRTRDLSEPLGDLRRAYRRYEEKTGTHIDMAVVDYHTIRFALMTPMPVAAICAFPPPRINLPQYLGWYHVYSQVPIALIAKLEGVTLEAPIVPEIVPEKAASRYSPAYKSQAASLKALLAEVSDPDLYYELDIMARNSEYLKRVDAMGAQIERDEMSDISQLLGAQPDNWQQADEQLEALVLASGLERNADFLQYFYCRCARQLSLLGPTLRELEGAQLQMLEDL